VAANLLVVGLGNPGSEYVGTRHNVGAAAIELLARRHNLALAVDKKLRARTATGPITAAVPGAVGVTGTSAAVPGVSRATVAVPSTFMNNSGESVTLLVRRVLGERSTADLARLVVIHDELDLAPGVVRVKLGGGTAGHNGLKSIGAHLHNFDFARIRIGIGKAPGSMPGANYVLRRVDRAEAEILDIGIERAADAAEAIAAEGVERAMNLFNTR
jgi:PTH1 family peptidyl-tRNA hydrolase